MAGPLSKTVQLKPEEVQRFLAQVRAVLVSTAHDSKLYKTQQGKFARVYTIASDGLVTVTLANRACNC